MKRESSDKNVPVSESGGEEPINSEKLISYFGDKRLIGYKAIPYLLITCFIFINLVFCLNYEWPQFIRRILTIKEFCFAIFALGGYFVQFDYYVVEKDYILKYLKIVDQHATSDAKRKIIRETNDFIRYHSRFAVRAFSFMFVFACCIPLLQVIIVVMKSVLKQEPMLKLPFVIFLYMPEGFRSPLVYLATQMVAFTWYGLAMLMWGIGYKIFLIAMKCICAEMQLLSQSLMELDTALMTNRVEQHLDAIGEDLVIGAENNVRLKRYLQKIIRHHQDIIKSMKLLNNEFQLTIIIFINIYSLQLCLYIIFILKMPEIVHRIKYLFVYVVVLFIQLQWATYGQDLINNGDRLRLALYESSWINKPLWMKKSLLIMMARAEQPLEFKPYGLYVLDKQYMANLFKATYTYVNVVYEFLN
ncbi:uncharacterized protein LOC111045943 [Nilaparvata lugens]|uniref:uncharacterized protein LOC111045943 n=1 Tax=Nilaparvata lugens TaxID=108931 RepID=UPI000B98CCAA|nr:uncharacterized protein LOC111045943 [Nilaparvata lugens]